MEIKFKKKKCNNILHSRVIFPYEKHWTVIEEKEKSRIAEREIIFFYYYNTLGSLTNTYIRTRFRIEFAKNNTL